MQHRTMAVMQLKSAVIRVLVVTLLAISAVCDDSVIDDIKKTVEDNKPNINLKDKGVGLGIRKDNGNPFYYEECSIRLSSSGMRTGCNKVFTTLFYACIIAGGLLVVLLIGIGCYFKRRPRHR